MNNLDNIGAELKKFGQSHLLEFAPVLSDDERNALLNEIGKIDLELMDELINRYVINNEHLAIPPDISPPEIISRHDESAHGSAMERGIELLSNGNVCAFTVAGGQGTRLGYDGPKGCFPTTPITGKSLFQVFAEQIIASARRHSSVIPWYILTSPVNDEATRDFFVSNDYWGLNPDDVMFVVQGTMPAIDYNGKLILADRHRLAINPDGHGGSLAAMKNSGALDDMKSRGVEFISYFQVDNPLVRAIDPLFIGLHAQANAGMSAKALKKRDPFEKVGNFCVSEGRIHVIEYSDFPDNLATAEKDDGTLMFEAGSIAIHIFSRSFVEHLTEGGRCKLPFHRADKTIPFIDPEGNYIKPKEPNGVKLEMFIFDAMPMSGNCVILETERIEEFSPVKNRTGVDSCESCKHDQIQRHALWLEKAGVVVPRKDDNSVDCRIEISPLFADSCEELALKIDNSLTITPGQELYLK